MKNFFNLHFSEILTAVGALVATITGFLAKGALTRSRKDVEIARIDSSREGVSETAAEKMAIQLAKNVSIPLESARGEIARFGKIVYEKEEEVKRLQIRIEHLKNKEHRRSKKFNQVLGEVTQAQNELQAVIENAGDVESEMVEHVTIFESADNDFEKIHAAKKILSDLKSSFRARDRLVRTQERLASIVGDYNDFFDDSEAEDD